MTLQLFADLCDAVRAAPKRLEKIALVASYLSTLSDDDLDAAARFLQGRQLPPRESTVPLGHRTIADAAAHVLQIKSTELRAATRRHGELGEALGELFTQPLDFGLFREILSPATLRDHLRTAAQLRGAQAARKRAQIVEKLYANCVTGSETAILTKILGGELRIGLREGNLLEAVALAFDRSVDDVRRAAAANADTGYLACMARRDELAQITPTFGQPISSMLASPVLFGSAYDEVADSRWFIEDKFDGIRAQLHVYEGEVRLFSRSGNAIEANFPEIVAAARGMFTEPVIFDGEVIAARDGRPLAFSLLQPRILKQNPTLELQAQVPVQFVAFDLLAHGVHMRIDSPWLERRNELAELFARVQSEVLVLSTVCELTEPRAQTLEALFVAARARGNEGLMLKTADSAYSTGRRGKSWLKLKKEFATLDVVVVAVEWGHGKRAKMLSDYTFAVRGKDETLLAIGKAYSGLTDSEIQTYTEYFQAHMTGENYSGRSYAVFPNVVIEVAFDRIAESALHPAGFALRFPRIVRIRDDKTVNEIATLDEVAAVHAALNAA